MLLACRLAPNVRFYARLYRRRSTIVFDSADVSKTHSTSQLNEAGAVRGSALIERWGWGVEGEGWW